jgi:transcriptional regulator with XRE-family HTH domain
VSDGVVSHWEKGRTTLTAARIEQLARALRITPAALRLLPGEPMQLRA